MAIFVIETYLSRTRPGELEQATARLRAAIEHAARRGLAVRHVRSFFVPGDEMASHIVEAATLDDAVELGVAARLSPERVVEAEAAVDGA